MALQPTTTAVADGRMKPDSLRTEDTGRAGIVLAGGRSSRFPTVDKALAPLNGKPLLWHAVSSLTPTVDEIILNCREEQRQPFASALEDVEISFAVDATPDCGPLAGLQTALEATGATYAAVLPCDMPLVPAAFIDVLFSRAQNRTGAVGTVDGRVQPFPGVFHVRAATAACHEVVHAGSDRIETFISQLDPRVLSERAVTAHVEPRAFANINTHEDLAAVHDELRTIN